MKLDNISLSPANFKKRFMASLIDLFFPVFVGLLPAALISYSLSADSGFKILYMYMFLIIIWFLIYFANVIFYQTKTGRTLGKLIMGIKVCYPNDKVDVRQEDIIKRELAKLFTLVTAGYSFFKNYKEVEILTFHDEYSKTVVLVLSEEHEEYLYEHHYEDYFTSEEEDKEYERLIKEKQEIEKAQREEEERQKEYQRQIELDNKRKEQEKRERAKMGQHEEAEEIKELLIPGKQGIIKTEKVGPENLTPTYNPSFQTIEEGVNIVDDNDLVINNNEPFTNNQSMVNNNQVSYNDNNSADNYEPKKKKKGIFGGKKSEEDKKYKSTKLSELVQDNNYLPSENIYSELYRGWNIQEASQVDVKSILNKR